MSAAAEKEHTISIKPHEAEVLKELVLKYHVNTALEIGLAYGASAMTMLGARSELKLTSCDPFQQEDYQNSGLSKIADAGFQSRHTHIKALSDQALPKLLAEGKTYDLIFIDGDHKFSGAFVDFHFAAQMIENNGIVVFHDMWMRAASIIYQSGSTKFGDTSDDVHSFSGSLRVTGSGDHYFTDGRVGIGTTSPGTVLDIHGTGNVLHVGTGTIEAQYMSFRGSGASGAYIGYDGTGMLLQPGDGKRFLIRGGNATWGSGTVGLLVDTSGNVGIGTTSPSYKLQVHGDAAFLSAAGSLNGLITQGSEGKGRLYLYDAGNATIGLQTNGNSYFNNGNVGIGTTNPSSKLHITDTAAAFQFTADTGTAGDGRLHIGHFSNGTFIGTYGDDGGAADVLRFGTHSGDERMRIQSSGAVGINNSSPDSFSASVSTSSSLVIGQGTSGVSPGLTLWQGNSAQATINFASANTGAAQYEGRIRYTRDTGVMDFRTNSVDNVLVLNASGNVGIGTSSPSQKITIGFADDGTDGLSFRSATYANLAKILVQNESSSQNGNIQFHTRSGGDVIERMRIDSSGIVQARRARSNTAGNVALSLQPSDSTIHYGFRIDQANNFLNIDRVDSAGTIMTLDPTGKIGIGTTSPDDLLELKSDGSNAGGAIIRLTHANNNSTDVIGTVNFSNNVGSAAMIQGGTTGANNTGYISFFTDNAGSSSEKMRILGDGNVGTFLFFRM